MHRSVLLEEAVAALVTRLDGVYVDGTFGRGGHSRAILQRLGPDGTLLVMDKDPEAVAVARELQKTDTRVKVYHGSFAEIGEVVKRECGADRISGVLLDLGVSSPQLDEAGRGFSFMKDGPLDMRMNTERGQSAAQWLQRAAEEEIARVIYEYGEERYSRRIARAIVQEREKSPITGTLQLAQIVKQAHPAWEKHKHPATRAFQGIRIFINEELQDLQHALPLMLELLETGGRLVVISFHSLEDRIVKRFIQKEARGDEFPPGVPVTQDMLNPRLKAVGKALKVAEAERDDNIRSRSAVMRVAEKIA